MAEPTGIGQLIAVLVKSLTDLARHRPFRRAFYQRTGKALVGGRVQASQPYSVNAQLWAVVPLGNIPTPFEPRLLGRTQEHGWFVTPMTFVLWPQNSAATDDVVVRITDLILRPLTRDRLDPSDFGLLLDTAPMAGGRGSEASFSVWLRSGLEIAIPLLTELRIRGETQVPDIELRAGDQCEVAVAVSPDRPGLYEFELAGRFSTGAQTWSQTFEPTLRIAVLGERDYEAFSR